jgi:putative transcriptional regulator
LPAIAPRVKALVRKRDLLFIDNESYAQGIPRLHNRIALFRTERGLSRRELADAVGVNPQTIGYLERGDYAPSLELGMKIAAAFDVPVELVFSFTPFPSVADALRRAGDV